MKHQLKASEYVLSLSNIKKIIYGAQNFRNRVLISTMYYQGLRRSEVCNLKVEHINFSENYMHVYGKFNKVRTIPLMSQAWVSDVKHLVNDQSNGFVFLNNRSEGLSNRMVNNIVASAAKRAGIVNPHPGRKNINPHIFRHSIARHLKDAGYNAEFIQKFLGHSSISTTMDEYGTLTLEDMKRIQSEKTGNEIVGLIE